MHLLAAAEDQGIALNARGVAAGHGYVYAMQMPAALIDPTGLWTPDKKYHGVRLKQLRDSMDAFADVIAQVAGCLKCLVGDYPDGMADDFRDKVKRGGGPRVWCGDDLICRFMGSGWTDGRVCCGHVNILNSDITLCRSAFTAWNHKCDTEVACSMLHELFHSIWIGHGDPAWEKCYPKQWCPKGYESALGGPG